MRANARQERLAHLMGKYRTSHITVAEAREIIALKARDAQSRAHLAWRNRGDNAERCRAYTQAWRAANPGMG